MKFKEIKKHLSKDKILKSLIEKHGEIKFEEEVGDLFLNLVEIIINQQLSSKAASTIFERFKKLFGRKKITPKTLLSLSDSQLRKVGISFSKIKYIKNIAQAVLDGLLDFKEIEKLSDEVVIETLSQIKGVGKWSAQMFLMFSLKRPDVFSVGDLGIRKAIYLLYKIKMNDLKAIEELSLKWQPYRTFACRYLWRSLG